MGRGDLERLSKEELIELVLRLQRPEKTSRTSSKPPSTDRKEQREQSKPGGAKPGHEGHSRAMGDQPDDVVDHSPTSAHPVWRLSGDHDWLTVLNEPWLLLACGVLVWVVRPRRQRVRRAGLCRDGVRCARTGRSRGSPAACPARCRGAGAATSAAATRTPRWC